MKFYVCLVAYLGAFTQIESTNFFNYVQKEIEYKFTKPNPNRLAAIDILEGSEIADANMQEQTKYINQNVEIIVKPFLSVNNAKHKAVILNFLNKDLPLSPEESDSLLKRAILAGALLTGVSCGVAYAAMNPEVAETAGKKLIEKGWENFNLNRVNELATESDLGAVKGVIEVGKGVIEAGKGAIEVGKGVIEAGKEVMKLVAEQYRKLDKTIENNRKRFVDYQKSYSAYTRCEKQSVTLIKNPLTGESVDVKVRNHLVTFFEVSTYKGTVMWFCGDKIQTYDPKIHGYETDLTGKKLDVSLLYDGYRVYILVNDSKLRNYGNSTILSDINMNENQAQKVANFLAHLTSREMAEEQKYEIMESE
eukprot:Pgem_evm1s19042